MNRRSNGAQWESAVHGHAIRLALVQHSRHLLGCDTFPPTTVRSFNDISPEHDFARLASVAGVVGESQRLQ